MRFRTGPLILATLLLPQTAFAQTPLRYSAFSLELRGDLAVPTSTFQNRFDLETGFGFGAAVKYSVAGPLSLYAGWDRFEFDGTPEQQGVEVIDKGFRLGAQVGFPEPIGQFSPFATGGVIFNRASLEVRNTLGTTEVEGDRSRGYELGGGVMFPLLDWVWLVPEGRFRSHPSSWETTAVENADVQITYVAFNLGIVIRWPRPAPE